MPSLSSPHPMVDVPDAIRAVLRETARLLLTEPRDSVLCSVHNNDDQLVHQVLAEPVVMPEPGYPPYRASIMDGYAIRVADTSHRDVTASQDGHSQASDQFTHEVIDKVYAGDLSEPKSKQEASSSISSPAYYVTTGAVVPDSFDCVVPMEQCTVVQHGSQTLLAVASSAEIATNKWIRPIGSDILPGTVVLPKDHVIDAVALGLLRQAGCERVCIRKPVTVGILSTGNELDMGNARGKGKSQEGLIPDVNRPVLLALLKTFNTCKCLDLGIARDDDAESMARIIQDQLEYCEIIITTGGISMGESDIVEDVLVNHLGGTLHFGRLNMKPGKPTTFVVIPSQFGTRFAFAMPGNPVSALVCSHLLVRPCVDMIFRGSHDRLTDAVPSDDIDRLARDMAEDAQVHAEIQAILSHDIKLDMERPEYHRVRIDLCPHGSYEVKSTGVQQSSRLMSMRDAEGLLVLPRGTAEKPTALCGESYTVLLLRALPKIPRLRLADSKHFAATIPRRTSKVGLVSLDASDTEQTSLKVRVTEALTGSSRHPISIESSRVFLGAGESLLSFLESETDMDIHVVVSSKFSGRHLASHLATAQHLRTTLLKHADTMALQMRLGVASQHPLSALFETVVGFMAKGRGALVLFIPEQGLDAALVSVRSLLEHALDVARS